ncbi:CRC domain-containing protein TSO1-like [Hibiscus syriacus]|uniref:CRC domain-containing protein TSO1-like n=1 Tax=Hibiscus syriacus TaxID=106335 RepID=A0A6A3AIW2_HIBSY|nr:CRC domain-containing protein TSO1-like [Hibiscus syriacus]
MTTGIVPEQNLEEQIGKQMGCMAGFLQIFDRHQILTGKCLHSTKRLPPSPASETTSEEKKVVESPLPARELEKEPQGRLAPSPDRFKQFSAMSQLCSPAPESFSPKDKQNEVSLPLSVFEFKEGRAKSPWKFSKEAPRLSLDSRAVVDAKGSLKPCEIRTNQSETSSEENGVDDNDKQRRSPSVIVRLMGLGSLPNSDSEPNEKAELRRSASEARGRDLFLYRFIDGVNFRLKPSQLPNFQNEESSSNVVRENVAKQAHLMNNRSESLRNARTEPMKTAVRGLGQRKCFYESADFFPEPKQTFSIYGEIEKRLKLRGIDEPSKDLETLKQILEALQLKGLLHTKKPPSQTNNRNFVYENEQSPVTVIKPGRSPAYPARRIGNELPPSSNRSRLRPRQNLSIEVHPTQSPRHFRSENERNQRKSRGSVSPTRSECGAKSLNRRPLSVETQRRGNSNVDQRRLSPVQSPRVNNEEKVIFVPAEDGTSTVSESSISTCSQTDTERSKVEEYKDGRSLLERCDKLLHSIAEMTASTKLQLSPVSVLDSSFARSRLFPLASSYLPDNSDVFLLLEKQQLLKGDAINGWGDHPVEMSESVLDIERLIFKDLIVETILDLAAFSGESNKISALRRKLVF